MFNREAFCQRYFMRKEADSATPLKTDATSGAGLSGEGRHSAVTNVLGSPEKKIPAVAINSNSAAIPKS